MLAYGRGQVLCFMAVLHKWLTGLLCSCLPGTVHAGLPLGGSSLARFFLAFCINGPRVAIAPTAGSVASPPPLLSLGEHEAAFVVNGRSTRFQGPPPTLRM